MAERRQQKNCDPFFVPMARFDGSIDGTAYPMTMMDHLTMVDQRRALSVRTSTSGQGEVTVAALKEHKLGRSAMAGGFRLRGRRTPKAAQRKCSHSSEAEVA